MRTLKTENPEMVRFAVATVILIAAIGSSVFAQDTTQKLQVFGGYSLVNEDKGRLNGPLLDLALHQPANTFGVASNFEGWNAEAQYNANRWVGIVADFSGRSGKPITGVNAAVTGLPNSTAYTVLVGPAISYHNRSRFTPFVHALFGWDRTSLSASTIAGPTSAVSVLAENYTDFAVAFGGGVDCKLAKHFALRLGQVDWFHTSVNLNKVYGGAFDTDEFGSLSTRQRNWRVSAGVIVQF
jgi:opacity protein-like surface antigen